MGDLCCGWRVPKTAKHFDGVDHTPLDRLFHSPAASKEDNEVKRDVRVGIQGGDGGIVSYQLHNRRYLNAKIPPIRGHFLESPEFEEMRLKFEQVERQKRRNKAGAGLSPRRGATPTFASAGNMEVKVGSKRWITKFAADGREERDAFPT